MSFVALWFLCAAAALVIAASKGRMGCGFLILTLLLPLVGFIMAVAWAPAPRIRRICDFCAEPVQEQATVCPHCRRDLPATSAQIAAASASRARDLGLSTPGLPQPAVLIGLAAAAAAAMAAALNYIR